MANVKVFHVVRCLHVVVNVSFARATERLDCIEFAFL